MNFSLFHLLFWFFSILPMCELLKPILGSGWKWYSKRSTEHDQVKWQPTKGETTHSSLKAIPETAFSQHKPKNLRWGRGCQREGRREGRWDAACNKHFPCAWSCAKDLHTHFPIYSSPPSSAGKRSICNAGDPVLIPGSGRSPGEGNGYPFQYSCLENSMDRGAWQATVCGVAKSHTRLNNFQRNRLLNDYHNGVS